ncbi:MAG: polysaccharide deacetylase family protein [Syntrophomonadaceae bacterium]|nr:polysaccharide deacetylase family protein [Syntrophomonadaceae bacterium]
MKNRWLYWLAVFLVTSVILIGRFTSFPEHWLADRSVDQDVYQDVYQDGSGNGETRPADPAPHPDQNLIFNQAFSWWFQRQPDHQAPQIDPLMSKLLQGRGLWIGDTSKKQIYLTLDCGYENGYTAIFLDVLKRHQVTAIFFVTGSYVENNPELVRRMAAEGHLIGNHSETHPSFPRLSDEEKRQEIQALNQRVEQLTGQTPRYFRPPSGEFDWRTLSVAREMGCRTVFWSLAYRDWLVDQQPGREEARRQVLDNVHNGAIILLHAVSRSNCEAFDQVLSELKQQGYSFGTLDEIE